MDITKFISSRRDTAELLGDYGAYGRQLSRRIHTLRKRLGRTTPKHGKYTAKPAITAEEICHDSRFAQLHLLTAERAWAHAVHLKSVRAEDNAGQGPTGDARKLIISRMHKAATYAGELATTLANQEASGASDEDVLEAKAYAFTLVGAEELEKHVGNTIPLDEPAQIWKRCLENYAAARIIYNMMLQKTKQDVFQDMLTNLVDPSIRYAAYQSELSRTIAVPVVCLRSFPRSDAELVKRIERIDPDALKEKSTSSRKGAALENVPFTVTWRSRTAKIQDASVGQAIGAVKTAESGLTSFLSDSASASALERAASYDDVLLASQDAVDATRHAIEELEREKVDESDPRMQDLRVTNLVVNYDLIGWRVGRNRVLIGADDGASRDVESSHKSKRSRKGGKETIRKDEGNGRRLARYRERVVLFDSILQSIDSVKELAGAGRDAEFMQHLDGHRAYFQALKCLNIAYSHAILGKTKNALALLLRAKSLRLSEGVLESSSITRSDPPKLEIDQSRAKALQELLENQVWYYTGLVEIENIEEAARQAAQKNTTKAPPLVKRLDEYPATGVDLNNLVQYPPQLEPIPVKPLFFDVAWNYIDYHGRKKINADSKAAADTSAPGQEEKPRRGWFGFGR